MNLTGTPNNFAADEHNYWRSCFASRPYVTAGAPYEKYGPAYQFGWEMYASRTGKTFGEIEGELAKAWDAESKTKSGMKWSEARAVVRDSFTRCASRKAA